MMDTTIFILLYLTSLVVTTCITCLAASTDFKSTTVPPTLSPDHHSNTPNITPSPNIHYDITYSHDAVTTMTPRDFPENEAPSTHVHTSDFYESASTVSHGSLSTDRSRRDPALEPTEKTVHRTVHYEEGSRTGRTGTSIVRTHETTSVVSLTDSIRKQNGDAMQPTALFSNPEPLTLNHGQGFSATTESSEGLNSTLRPSMTSKMNMTLKRTTQKRLSSSLSGGASSKSSDPKRRLEHRTNEGHDKSKHHRDEGLVTETNINHAALWITVAFVAVLLVYITVLIIYNAKRRDWHQSLPPYTRFMEEMSQEDGEATSILDKMLQRISGKKNNDDGYSLSF